MARRNTNLVAAKKRRENKNSLYNRVQSRVGGWETTPSGLKTRGVEISSADSSIKVSSSANKFSELSSDKLTFTIDGGTTKHNYARQVQFIPANKVEFGTALDFTDADAYDYENTEYDVLFIPKNIQVFDAGNSGSDQNLQLSAENKTTTGFLPTAKLYVGSLSTTAVTSSFGDSTIAERSPALGSTPANSVDYHSNDATHDKTISNVVRISVTFTVTFSSVVNKAGEGLLTANGYVRVGTQNSSAFDSSNYLASSWSTGRSSNGTETVTLDFFYASAIANDTRVSVVLDDFTEEFGATGSVAGTLTSIVYTVESGTTVNITGTDKADALVMAR